MPEQGNLDKFLNLHFLKSRQIDAGRLTQRENIEILKVRKYECKNNWAQRIQIFKRCVDK